MCNCKCANCDNCNCSGVGGNVKFTNDLMLAIVFGVIVGFVCKRLDF